MAERSPIAPVDHLAYMRYALSLAKKAPPKPTNFCVGAVLVDEAANAILSTGYTMELPGNTHAEQCCLVKAEQSKAEQGGPSGFRGASQKLVLYTTMEPCNKRASENMPCTETILKNGEIKVVYVGVKEPEKFVGENVGRAKLEEAGIQYVHVFGLEAEILQVATVGHEKS